MIRDTKNLINTVLLLSAVILSAAVPVGAATRRPAPQGRVLYEVPVRYELHYGAVKETPTHANAAPGRRRAVGHPSAGYYLDRDGDGQGDRTSPLDPSDPRAVRTASDCDDTNPRVFQEVRNLAPDCNVNGVADDLTPTVVCVGDAEKRVFVYEDGRGTVQKNVYGYTDARGRFWVSLNGQTSMDSQPRTCPRY